MNTRPGTGSITPAAIAIAALLVFASALATPAVAGSHPPLGYQLMCLETPQECKGGGKERVTVTSEVMATLKSVNSHFNRTIKPRYDAAGTDVWNVSATAGDCEDYVLAKRRALIRAGIPASSLRIAYVKTRNGVGHAVLVVKTNGWDLVLDNLSATIKPLSQTGYRIIAISGANPLNWS